MLWSIFCPVSIFLTLLIVAFATNVVLILVKCSTFSLVSHVWVSRLRHGCWIQEPKDVYTHPSSWFCLILLLLGNKASHLIVCVQKSTCASPMWWRFSHWTFWTPLSTSVEHEAWVPPGLWITSRCGVFCLCQYPLSTPGAVLEKTRTPAFPLVLLLATIHPLKF